jgi:hypothetical protein
MFFTFSGCFNRNYPIETCSKVGYPREGAASLYNGHPPIFAKVQVTGTNRNGEKEG